MPNENRLPFTKGRAQALPVPATGRRYYYDEKTPGLALCVTANASRTFYVYRRIKGRPTRVRIGRFPETTIETARKAAAEIIGQIVHGQDPHAVRRADREEMTVADLFAYWIVNAKGRKKTWEEDARLYRQFLAGWASRRLSAVSKADVRELHARIGRENGRYVANRVLELIHAAYVRAGADLDWGGVNPAEAVEAFPEKSRDRFLRPDELPRFFAALEPESPMIRDFFILALLTAARRGNLLAARWEEINLNAEVWRIPETKNGSPVNIPLVPEAVEILRARREATAGSEWVFPSRSKTGHLVSPKSAWKRIVERAGLVDLRVHDLRRSMGSWLAASGASLPMIGRMLGHRDGSRATAVYARLDIAPVRQAANKAAAAMLSAAGIAPNFDDDQVEEG